MAARPATLPELPPLAAPAKEWAVRVLSQDVFLFFHVDARPGDFRRIYEYGCLAAPAVFTSVAWQHDHLVVQANALYVSDDYEPLLRLARPLALLVQYYATLRHLGRQLESLTT